MAFTIYAQVKIKTDVRRFGISRHTALKLDIQTLRSYSKLICNYERHTSPNIKAGAAKDHVKGQTSCCPPSFA